MWISMLITGKIKFVSKCQFRAQNFSQGTHTPQVYLDYSSLSAYQDTIWMLNIDPTLYYTPLFML